MISETNRRHFVVLGPILAAIVAVAALSAGCDDAVAAEFVPTEDHESALGNGWMAAGQPSEDRLTEVVNLGAHIVNIRPAEEDPYDEEALVASLGGTYARFGVKSSRYPDPDFREDLYDFMDVQMGLGGLVYFHCKSSNRIGAAWALYHFERKGVTAEEALAMGRAAGLKSLDPVVQDILGLSGE